MVWYYVDMVGSAISYGWSVLTNPATWKVVGDATAVASSAYGLGSAVEADKQAGEQRAKEEKMINEENAKQLGIRKQMIDKTRLQLLGVGDGKYNTMRTGSTGTSPTGTNGVTLG
jgi:hypothetical protein